jgi:hypothetical protein
MKCQDCERRACFNYLGNTPMYCSKHKKEDMIDVRNKTCQFEGGCDTHPSFNYQGNTAMYCFKHKQEGMVKCQEA